MASWSYHFPVGASSTEREVPKHLLQIVLLYLTFGLAYKSCRNGTFTLRWAEEGHCQSHCTPIAYLPSPGIIFIPPFLDHKMLGRTSSCKVYFNPEYVQFKVDRYRMPVEAPMPIPSRAQRLRRSTTEMENLYRHSAAKGSPTIAQQDTPFRIGFSRQNLLNDTPAVLNDNDVGVPLSQEVLEGRVPPLNRTQKYIKHDPRLEVNGTGPERHVRDARGLGIRRGPGSLTIGRTGAVDARNLGARPEVGNPSMERSGAEDAKDIRPRSAGVERASATPNRVPRDSGADTKGLEIKQRFPPREPRLDLQQDGPRRTGFAQDDGASKGRMPQESRSQRYDPRAERNPEYRDTRRQGDRGSRDVRENASTGRGPQVRRGGMQSARAGRPRTSRRDEADEPRRRKRNKESASGNDYAGKTSAEATYNEEEKKYAKAKWEREMTPSIAYEPAKISREAFSGVGPAFVSGEMGMSEVLGENLLLAKRHMDGEYVEWHSKEQKADVLTLVRKLKQQKTNSPSSSRSTEAEQQAQNLLQKLLGGKYEFTKPQQAKDILGDVARHTDRNESYYPADQQSLLAKVKSVVPANKTGKDQRVGR